MSLCSYIISIRKTAVERKPVHTPSATFLRNAASSRRNFLRSDADRGLLHPCELGVIAAMEAYALVLYVVLLYIYYNVYGARIVLNM